MIKKLFKEKYNIDERIYELAVLAEKKCRDCFDRIDKVKEYNQLRVLSAFEKNCVSDSHFSGSTGYGYNDRGREVLEDIYADVFGTEDALVRPQIVTGTHALALCLFGILRPGDELLSVTGKPYDTLDSVIGLKQSGEGSLKEFGISFVQVPLLNESEFDFPNIKKSINSKTKMVFIQRSRGYEWRKSLSVESIADVISYVKNIKNDIIVLVDNCYGEFVKENEPTHVGADLMAGSLIKNPGGGLAKTGGYIAGKKDCVNLAACRLTTPGIGKEVGATLNTNRDFFQGLFLAPHVVAESLKGAVFCASIMEELKFESSPSTYDERSDIIQAVKFNNDKCLKAFCRGIQKGSPVDSFVVPEPWDMPGYDSQVIMASGAFVQGSSIELSADGPLKSPYIAYMQGGLVYESAKTGVIVAVQNMYNEGLLTL